MTTIITEMRSYTNIVSFDNLVPEPGEVVDTELVLASIDTDQHIQALQHLHLGKPSPGDEREH